MLIHPDEAFVIFYDLYFEFNLELSKNLKETSCGALTNGIASNPRVLKFVKGLAVKSVETMKLKIVFPN